MRVEPSNLGNMEPTRNEGSGYRSLEIYQIARKVSVAIHKMSLALPKFEMYEEGSQIKRSSKSIRSNIVEGYGRRRYKQEFIRFLVFAHASCDETIDHLETLHETSSLSDQQTYEDLLGELNTLGRKINLFTQSVERQHLSVCEERALYGDAELIRILNGTSEYRAY